MDWLTSYLLIFAAEIGDKSQLVCMALAIRYRALPVAVGAILAFLVLNTLAVVFGSAIANWIPELAIYLVVSAMFLLFGFHALLSQEDGESEEETETEALDETDLAFKSKQHIILSTFALIAVAEFADKTQLAVVGLSSHSSPLSVWIGSTLALITTSIMAVWAGKTILQRFPIALLHRFSGALFIILALFAAYSAFQLL
mgnify:CR=1 FL=1